MAFGRSARTLLSLSLRTLWVSSAESDPTTDALTTTASVLPLSHTRRVDYDSFGAAFEPHAFSAMALALTRTRTDCDHLMRPSITSALAQRWTSVYVLTLPAQDMMKGGLSKFNNGRRSG